MYIGIQSFCSAVSFLPGTDDVPQMPGLKVDVTDNMDFDTPVGQIITLEGIDSEATASSLYEFYQTVLPKMGWKQVEKGYFKREKDSLHIIVIRPENPLKVRFEISLTNSF